MTEPLSKQLLKGARRALRWVGRKGANSESSVTPELRSSGAQLLFEHTNQFSTAEVIEVTEGVHVAIGYGLANSVLIEGTDGVIIVDTLESDEAARPVKEAFVAINDAPVRALVYTHNHADHIFGSRTMAGDDEPEVYAHETTREHITKIVSVVRPAIFTRSMRQFGVFLPPGDHLNSGIGPRLLVDDKTSPGLLWPTHTVSDSLKTKLAGVDVEFGHIPGETPDHLYVWLPDRGVLIPGDDYYHTFPNLYAIRGTAYRDVMDWARSIDRLIDLKPEILVPCHTRPVHGRTRIREQLTHYRDAIQFVHDQTVRGINEGLTPDEIVRRVELPPALAKQPYLHEHYGRVDWSVRAIFAGYMGWFDGDAATLRPLPPTERAGRMIELAGGLDVLMTRAQAALDGGDEQWAVELVGHVLSLEPEHPDARRIRSEALRALGEAEISANGRNYYLTQAREAAGVLQTPRTDPAVAGRQLAQDLPMSALFASMSVALLAEEAIGLDVVIGFHFTDTAEHWSLHVRHAVAVVRQHRPEAAVARLSIPASLFKQMMIGARSPATTLARSEVSIEGDKLKLMTTLALFEATA